MYTIVDTLIYKLANCFKKQAQLCSINNYPILGTFTIFDKTLKVENHR
jgi:hypothetical protein